MKTETETEACDKAAGECMAREDGVHCAHWWDAFPGEGVACCACGYDGPSDGE